jgi:hypothetical protein
MSRSSSTISRTAVVRSCRVMIILGFHSLIRARLKHYVARRVPEEAKEGGQITEEFWQYLEACASSGEKDHIQGQVSCCRMRQIS